MDVRVKQAIIKMKVAGFRYADIARQLNIPASTVKSFAYRHSEEIEEAIQKDSIPLCTQCSAVLPPSKYKPRRFCSDKCRIHYWHHHREELRGKAMTQYQCPTCGKSFVDYPQKARKYCSHPCYIAARFSGGQTDGQEAV